MRPRRRRHPAGQERNHGRKQAAEVEVLLGVDVGDHAREQVALAVAVELGRRERLDALVDARPHPPERAQRDVVRREPLEVSHDRPGEAERLDRGDGDHQRQDRRPLGGA